MNIEFLYFEDCPSHDKALERLHEIMHQEGIDANIEIIKVETDEQAQKWRFIGSPTIRINDKDIDLVPEDTQYMLSCRIYHWDDGRISPLPSPDMIRNALHKANT